MFSTSVKSVSLRLIFLLAAIFGPLGPAVIHAKNSKCVADMPYLGAPAKTYSPPPYSLSSSALSSSALSSSAHVAAPQTGHPGLDPDRLDASFTDMLEKSRAHSLTIALARGNGEIWSQTGGLDAEEQTYYWASVGKTFTAVLIMQLVETGRLSLDDRLSHWIHDVPHGDLITIRMLLNHSSGLYSVNEDMDLRAKPRALSLADTINLLKKHGPLFCPGQYWRYSNTGYVFLGLIAEQLHRKPFADIVDSHIIKPLGLKETTALTINGDRGKIAAPQPGQSENNMPDIRTPGAAGPVAASAADMVRFWRAFMQGKLVRTATRDIMLATLYPMFDPGTFYGLGVMMVETPVLNNGPNNGPNIGRSEQQGGGQNGRQKTWLGHSGGMPGVKAFVMIDPETHDYAAVALTGDGPASAIAYQMLRIWQGTNTP